MDYGSMLTYTVGPPGQGTDTNVDLALKGVCIRLGAANDKNAGAICFDTDLLRYYAGWTGGFLNLSRTHLTSSKGSWHALIDGDVKFRSGPGPGWSTSDDFTDPRPMAAGPLPREWGRYKGLFRHGDQVILSYEVAGNRILEMPEYATTNGVAFFVRRFHVARTDSPLVLRVCDADPANSGRRTFVSSNRDTAGVVGDSATWVRVQGVEGNVSATPAGRIQVHLPVLPRPTEFQVILWTGPNAVATKDSVPPPTTTQAESSLPGLCRGGQAQWPHLIPTRSRLATNAAPYVVDTVGVPEANPWRSWMRLVAFDFFSDGRAAVSTWNGDVWIVSGLDEELRQARWRRFAAGLFEPLGLKIVDDEVFVLCRDQLMRLRDVNGDGEADSYECFNGDTWLSPSYHAFAFDLQTDRAGNFYYTRCGQRVDPALPLNGGMVKVAGDGSRAELIATGLRAANGMAIGPGDEIVCGDNQGNWIPSSRLNWIKPGAFYGYMPHARREPPPSTYEPPICWLPMKLDNSSGGQVWVTSDRWGPLQGQLLHTSYGRGTLFLVMIDDVQGTKQGGVVQFPVKFESGIMRARFHPKDGQLWVCGLRGWQTSGGRDGALQRVRYTGRPAYLPSALHVASNGINLTFTAPLDPASANDPQNYAAEQWNYRWTEKYGSPEFSVANPGRQGHDSVTVNSVSLSSDGRTVFLELPDLRPVMQMRLHFRLRAEDGTEFEHEVFGTINRVPGSRGEPGPSGINGR
jgi:hypothetical protein